MYLCGDGVMWQAVQGRAIRQLQGNNEVDDGAVRN